VSPREHSQVQLMLQLLFWAAGLFAFVMALIPHPPNLGNDKFQHMAAFATLGLLASLAYPRVSALKLLLGLSLFGAMIEIAQAIPVIHRDSDPLDWLADTVACGIVLLVLRLWRARSR
jgi:hypothetical protein